MSLYISSKVKLLNKKGQLQIVLISYEFPTIYFDGMDTQVASARSNLVAPVLGMQSIEQFRNNYGREQADVLFNLPGNVINGRIIGETAHLLSKRSGRI